MTTHSLVFATHMALSKLRFSQMDFDYIIVGGGSAGCVLANRLSADPTVTVLLLEAGGPDTSRLIHYPAGYSKLVGPKVSWEFRTTPQKHVNNREMHYPQGMTLGGGSSINAMVYIRGNKNDYDQWESLGNAGWGYAGCLPYFRKAESNQRFTAPYHGDDGPLAVSDQVSPLPLTDLFVKAAQQAGHPFNPDFNGAQQHGIGYYQVTQRNRRRGSSAVSYLRPVQSRPNLSVVTLARVLRLLISGGRVTGVEYTIGGSSDLKTARATREVISSSGAIGSPRLLLHSGIGPADELKAVGIEPMHDLPGVGKNLQDHLDVYAVATLKKPMSYDGQDKLIPSIKHGLQYLLYRTGPVTSNVCEGGAFLATDGNDDWPDNQMHFLPAYVVDHGRKKIAGHGMTLNTAYLRPEARGSVTVMSDNPIDRPLVDPNFLGVDEDLRRSIACFKQSREILAQPAFADLIEAEYMPGKGIRSDAEIADYVREWSKTDYHPVGTCKMGDDDMAVVDTQLRVRGLEGLRVIDSSIMPTLVSGNTNAPSIMIGEKGAAIMLAGAVV
ncbi:MAG: putative dehydrogenase [Devosia sp.]|nr:putative dehydrogenase [Devosia sp.]